MTDSAATLPLLHPGLLLVAGGLLLFWLRGRARQVATLALPLLALALVWQVPDGPSWQLRFLDHTLSPLQGDKLSRLFATIFSLMAAAGGLFALGQKSRLEVPAAFVYAGSAIGVTLAGDLITVFLFWELMAVGSTLVLWSQGSTASYAAARRYLMIHLLGGVVLFAGITGHVAETGSVAFTRMALDSPAHALILIGLLVNAGAPPLSAWLPDAYPEASWSGTVFLSAFTTKTAVYTLIRGFPGTELLIWVGLFMVFYGIVYALLENDMRRILAYSIVNQVGFMIAGIGIGTEMALNGAAAHAFTHIIYKALLLMSAGSVLLMTGRRKCSELGGLFHSMPLTTVCGSIGALAISSFPRIRAKPDTGFAFGDQAVFGRSRVGVAQRHAAHHHLVVGQAQVPRDDAVELREGRLRAGVQPARARRHHHVLQEHAVVQPAALLHDAVDGEDQAHRRAEEVVVAACCSCMRCLSALPMPSSAYRSQPTLRRRSM
jgi:multicomponent Na+:H+ antiporter subunit D